MTLLSWKPTLTAVAVGVLLMLAVGVGLVGSAGGARTRAAVLPTPRTILAVRSISAFAQDGNYIAWSGGWSGPRCEGLIHLRNLVSGKTLVLPGPWLSNGSDQTQCDVARMAVAGDRVLWVSNWFASHEGGEQWMSVGAVAPNTRPRIVDGATAEGDEEPGLVPVAGDKKTLAYLRDGVVRVTPQDHISVPWTSGAEVFALAGNEIALPRSLSPGMIANGNAVWSPDGREIAFTGAAHAGGSAELYVVDVVTGAVRELAVFSGSLGPPSWSPDGTYLATRAGRAVVVLDPSGKVHAAFRSGRDPLWAPDGRLAYVASSDLVDTLHVTRIGGPNKVIATERRRDNKPCSYSELIGNLEWSPGGTSLAYTSCSLSTEKLNVWRSGGRPRALATTAANGLEFLGWSPDAESLLYRHSIRFRVVPASGGSSRTVATTSDDASAAWSPKRNEIALNDNNALLIIDPVDGTTRQIAAHVGAWDWAPDGNRIAYWDHYDDGDNGNVIELHVADRDGRATRRIASASIRWPGIFWAPDGTDILFESSDGYLTRAPADGSGDSRIVYGRLPDYWEASNPWSPRGTRVIYLPYLSSTEETEDGAGAEIAVVNRDGSNPRTLTHTTPEPGRKSFEIRRATDGLLINSFDYATTVRALALDAKRIALIVSEGSDTRQLELRKRTGALIKSLTLYPGSADEVSLAGRWIVYQTGRTIRVIDTHTWKQSVLTIAKGRIVGLSSEARRVVWGEQRKGPDVIRSVTLPR